MHKYRCNRYVAIVFLATTSCLSLGNLTNLGGGLLCNSKHGRNSSHSLRKREEKHKMRNL